MPSGEYDCMDFSLAHTTAQVEILILSHLQMIQLALLVAMKTQNQTTKQTRNKPHTHLLT